jgi:predicted secreted acid phosphatase
MIQKGIAYSLCLMAISTSVIAKEPKNLDTYKNGLIAYHDSGNYLYDIDDVIKHALSYVQLRLEQNTHGNKKLAIVLDIDETALSTYDNMLKRGFGGTWDDIHRDMQEAKAPAIMPTLQLYRYAKAHGIAVIFITGRREADRALTESNLLAAGYKDWDGLILRSKEYDYSLASVYKPAMRKHLQELGYDIILNIGDQKSDLVGGYADKTFKLSNPYYFLN